MSTLHRRITTTAGTVHVVSTDRFDGDFAVGQDAASVAPLRAAIHPGPWSWIRQVHGADLVTVDEPGANAGATADGIVVTCAEAPAAVTTADCAPVVLVAEGAHAVIHAGWRGLQAGIIAAAARQLAVLGATPVASVLGPCIHPDGYEFGEAELDEIAARFGPAVRATTADGTPALDVPATVGVALDRAGWPPADSSVCTSAPEFFSHRTRGDSGRQTTVVWLEDAQRSSSGGA